MAAYQNFTIQTLAPGIHAVLASPGGALGCNCGIIDLGDQTIVWDTGLTVGAARELRAAAEALTGRPATYVINSHIHPDHVQGNAAFDDAVLIASDVSRQAFIDRGLWWLNDMRRQVTDTLKGLEAKLAASPDDEQLQRLVGIYESFLPGYPSPEDLRAPRLAFSRRMTFHGAARTAHLITFGGGHSECDAVLWLPEERILFAGDLAVPGGVQIFCYGNPEEWLRILDDIEALGADQIICGHGPVAGAEESYAHARKVIRHQLRLGEQALAEGKTVDDVADIPVPQEYAGGDYWFRENMKYLLSRGRR